VREQLFEDSVDMPNVHETISLGSLVDAQQTRESLEGKHVCPYCGAVNESPAGPCPNCSLENTPAGRKATKSRIGPWYVLQRRNPAAPGMKYDMLLNFVRKGRVKPRTVVRGPTTHQLWRFAAHVKGLSREFGLCYSCGGKIEANCSVCPQCNRLQLPPLNPDALLESGDAESPPGGVQTPAGAMGAAGGAPVVPVEAPANTESVETPAEPEPQINHDIVIPTLTDPPGQPDLAAPEPEANGSVAADTADTHVAVNGQSLTTLGMTEIPVSEAAPEQSTSLATVPAPSAPDAPVGARARSMALKAAGGVGGPRVVPLATGGSSPQPVLTTDPPPIIRHGARGRWRGVAEMALFLFVLVAALGGGLYLVDPSLRSEVQSAYDRVLKSDQTMPKPDEQSQDTLGMPGGVNGGVTDHPPAGPIVPPLESSNSVPKPDVVPPPAPQPAPKPPVIHTDQSSADAQSGTPAPSDPGQADENSTTPDADREQALYRAALDSEGEGDLASAVKDYRQIMKLPRSVWHTDVEQRLKYDEGLLGPTH
jgi:hypothetical protein